MHKTNNKKYLAFISYRHADNKEQGRHWATWLHQAIETYEVPSDLVGKKNGRGEEIPARIYPIFRDEEELPADADLGGSITRALDETRLLIVLCSPRAVASTYVADEIDYFKKLGHSDKIIAAMIDGEPNASWDKGKQASGYKAEDECFPTPLQFEYDQDGNQTTKHAEPIAADFRINNDGISEQGWISAEAYRLYLKRTSTSGNKTIQDKVDAYNDQQNLMLLKIIAGVLGVPLGELTQRDQAYQLALEQEKARKLRRWLISVAVLAVIAVVAGVLAWFKQQEAEEQKQIAVVQKTLAEKNEQEALYNQSLFLADASQKEAVDGNYNRSLLLALNGLPGLYGGDRNLAQPALDSLFLPLKQNKRIAQFKQKSLVMAVSENPSANLLLTASADGEAVIWEKQSGKVRYRLHHADMIGAAHFSPSDQTVLTGSMDRTAVIWSLKTGKKIFTLPHQRPLLDAQFAPSGKTILTVTVVRPDLKGKGPSTVTLWSASDGRKIKEYPQQGYRTFIGFSSDGGLFVSGASDGTINIYSSQTQEVISRFSIPCEVQDVVFSKSLQYLLVAGRQCNRGYLFSLDTQQLVHEFPHANEVNRALFSSDENSILTVANSEPAILWSVESGEKIAQYGHFGVEQLAVAFSPSGDRIVLSADQFAYVWDVETGKQLQKLTHDEVIWKANFLSETGQIITTSWDGSVILSQGVEPSIFPNFEMESSIISAGIDLISQRVLLGQYDMQTGKLSMGVFSLETGDAILNMDFPESFAMAKLIDKGKRILISEKPAQPAPNSDLFRIRIYDFSSESFVLDFSSSDPGLGGAIFYSAETKQIITSSRIGEVAFWSTINGDKVERLQLEQDAFMSTLFAKKQLLATVAAELGGMGANSTLQIWKGQSRVEVAKVKYSTDINAIEFSNSGNFLLVSLNDNVEIRRSSDGFLIKKIASSGNVRDAHFISDDKMLAIISDDNRIQIVSTNTGVLIDTIQFEQRIMAIVQNKLGDIVAVLANGDIQYINLMAGDKLIERAIKSIERLDSCLSPVERKQYFLPVLSDGQWIERGCSHFTKANRSKKGEKFPQ